MVHPVRTLDELSRVLFGTRVGPGVIMDMSLAQGTAGNSEWETLGNKRSASRGWENRLLLAGGEKPPEGKVSTSIEFFRGHHVNKYTSRVKRSRTRQVENSYLNLDCLSGGLRD